MVFSVDDRVLIKVLRQEKWYGANSPDLNPVDYQIWGKLQEFVYRSRNHDVDQLKLPLIEELEHFHKVFIDQAVAYTSSSLHLSTQRIFWTRTLVVFDICTYVHFDSLMSLWVPIVDTFVLGWPH